MQSLFSAILAALIVIVVFIALPVIPAQAPVAYEAVVPSPTPTASVPAKTVAAVPTPAAIKVSVDSLEIDASDPANPIIRTPQPVTVKARFSYKGTAKTSYRAELQVDGKVVQTRDLTISPGSQEETFVIHIGDIGKHKLSLGEKSSNFRIVESGLPAVKRQTRYATYIYNSGMEDILQTHIKNIDLAYEKVTSRLNTSLTDKLTVYVYVNKEDTIEGMRAAGGSLDLLDRYNRMDLLPQIQNDEMHTGSGTLPSCLNLLTLWTLQKRGFHYSKTAWLEFGLAEYLSYEIGITQDKELRNVYLARLQRLKKALDEDKLMLISDLEDQRIWESREVDKEAGTLAHDEAYAMVAFMVQNKGMSNCLSLFSRFADGRSTKTQEALITAFGYPYDNPDNLLKFWIEDRN